MDIDNLTTEQLKDLLDKMSKDERSAFLKLYLKNVSIEPITNIKLWLNSYDSSSPIDALLSNVVYQFIGLAGYEIRQDVKIKQEEGFDNYSGELAVIIACDVLERIINGMKSVFNKNDNEKH